MKLLFRLLDKDNKIVGYEKWYFGELNSREEWAANPCYLYSTDFDRWYPTPIIHRFKKLCTHIKDKNGTLIYEGDLVEVDHGLTLGGENSLGRYTPPEQIKYIKLVEWIGTGLSWEGSGSTLCESNTECFKVVGNIYNE